MWELVNFYLLPGVVLGCIYGLGALGVSLTFGVMRFANFAHGEVMMLGAYLAYTIGVLAGIHPLLAALPAMALASVVVLGLDKWFFKPMRIRASPTIMLVMVGFGLMLMVRSAVQFFWGVNVITVSKGVQRPLGFFNDWLSLPINHVYIIAATCALMVLTHYILAHTRTGKAMRAVSDNPQLARLTGVDTEMVIRSTWILGTCMAVAAGVFLAIDTHLETLMGFKMLLPMFAAAILGGIGKPFGAVAGGLIIGIAEEMSSFHWFGDDALLNPSYKSAVAFAIMVAMLIWRPSGLFRGRVF